MFSNVNSFLGFERGCIPYREVFVIGQREENGCFWLHQIVATAVKEQRPVCLLSFVQKFHHYAAVAQKLGASLQSALDAKHFQFLDGLQKLLIMFYPEGHNEPEGKIDFLEALKENLFDSLCRLRKTTQAQPVLAIDELSVLLSMGFHLDEVMMFVTTLLHSALGFSFVSTPIDPQQNGTSVAILCSFDENDEDRQTLYKFLVNQSTVDIKVTGLETGYCKDVHGQVSVTWRNGMDAPRCPSTKTLQFKLVENGAELFAAGMSSAVL